MKVLVLGAGAREHALVRRLRASREVSAVFAAPGNAGIAVDAECEAVEPTDVAALADLIDRRAVDLVVVGPEGPLVAGVADGLRARGVAVFGPGGAAARLEGSKVFAKEFMARHGVPTAAFRCFENPESAEAYVRSLGGPCVVKADGLAAGKGVVVAGDVTEALGAVRAMMRDRMFGDAGARVVIEERLSGEEISFHAITDGQRVVEMGAAQDHKRVGDGDTGANTGGMGAYAPVPVLTSSLLEQIRTEIVAPTLHGIAAEGLDYRGVLFFGLMLHHGRAHLLEYNVRFGDPECAVLLEQLDGDLADVLSDAAHGDLRETRVQPRSGATVAVVIAAHGYPAAPRRGDAILGIADAASLPGVSVLHAGTARMGDQFVTSGGRVLTIVARGDDVAAAAERTYAAVARISFDGAHFRRDIGWRARAH